MGKKDKSKAKLKAREAELEAKLKAKAKGKKAKPEAEVKHPHLEHLDHVGELAKVANDKSASKADRKAAKAKLAEFADDTHKRTAELVVGVAEVYAEHDDLEPDLEAKADAEDEARQPDPVVESTEVIKARVAAKRKAREGGAIGLAANDDAREGESEAEYQWRKKDERDMLADEARNAEHNAAAAAALAEVTGKPATKRRAKPVVEEVATENGREFAVGQDDEPVEAAPEPVDEFAKPSDAPPEMIVDHLNRYKITGPDGKAKALARVTTFIDCLEDKSALDKWKLRTLLEGVALNEVEVGAGDGKAERYLSLVAASVHERDVKVAKARKADRKGKLEPGELGDVIDAADKAFKAALNKIADDALELGGVHEKANKGTDIHALCELYDAEGIEAIVAKCEAGSCTPADLADVRAYAETMARLGIKFVASELVVVNETVGYAGRLDRIVLHKAPGALRAARMVTDIKTGRIDYGVGKLAMQLSAYANGEGYDPAAPEVRVDLKLSKKWGLVIHLPQGKAECHVYFVDLAVGAEGNKLAAQVRSFRNTGKKALDFKADLAAVEELVSAPSLPS